MAWTLLWAVICSFLPLFALAEYCTDDICEFELVIRHARTMVYKGPKKLYSVGLNGTKLEVLESYNNVHPDEVIGTFVDPSDVITADGYLRTIITINGQFPGPTIEVREGAQVVVRVVNALLQDVVTVHWHGLGMQGTPWMDGVPHVTQCPIDVHKSFTYRFIASPPGTHWYHSHVGGQRIDGLYGMFIIHPKAQSTQLVEFPLMVGDWYHIEGSTIEVIHPDPIQSENKGTGEDFYIHPKFRDYSHDGVNNAAVRWESALINGRGRHSGKKYPLTKFRVRRSQTYLFRMVNVGAEFSFRVSIDGHVLRVVASDGHDLEPFEVDVIIINPGEGIDFEVTANQIEGKYWVRAESPHDYTTYRTYDGTKHDVRAELVYDAINTDDDPTSRPIPCTPQETCKTFNCPFGTFPPSYNMTCINMDQVHSVRSSRYISEMYGVGDSDAQDLFLNIAYPPSINARSLVMPGAPLFQKDAEIVNCLDACRDPNKPCKCTNIINLPFNKTVQIVISNFQQVSFVGHHPMHIHGGSFAVMHIGYADHDPVTGRWIKQNEDVLCKDHLCREMQWNGAAPTFPRDRPVLKDTIIVPARGYTVVRLKTLNPGDWLFHCHMNHHLLIGMALIFKVGAPRIPPPPPEMPTCSDFKYTAQQFADQKAVALRYMQNKGNRQMNGPDFSPMENGPKQPRISRDGYVEVPYGHLVGIAVGCVVLGFLMGTIPILIYSYMKQKRLK